MTASTFILGLSLLTQIPTPGLSPRVANLPTSEVPDGLGANIHFTAPQPGELDRWNEAGFKWARTDLTWGTVEKEKGKYDFADYDRLVEVINGAGGRALLILDYGNPLYDGGKAPVSPEAQEAFLNYVSAAARHFAGKNILWEIWNEPNLPQFWKPVPDPAAYAKLAVATARALRGADPDAAVIGPGVSGFPWEYLEQVFRWGLLNEVDGISVHPYRESAPETVVEDYGRLRALIARYSTVDRRQWPIICSEWGYSTATGKFSEAEQASYLVRLWLVNLSQGVNLSVLYDWKDDGDNQADSEHRFGMVKQDLTPKPAFDAAKTMISELKGYSFRHRVFTEFSDPTWRLLFQKGNAEDYILVSWKPDTPEKRSDELPTYEKINSDHKFYESVKTLASIRMAAGPVAEIADQPEYVPLQVVTPDNSPTKIIATIDYGKPAPRYQFDGPSPGSLGLPLPATSSRILRRTMPVSWALGETKPTLTTVVDLWRADPLTLNTTPDATGVKVTLRSPSRTGFSGILQVMSRQPAGIVASLPAVIGDGEDRFTTHIARPAGTLDFNVLGSQNQQIALPVSMTVQPLAGFPTVPGGRTGWFSILAVENKPEPAQPVAAIALEPTAPAAAALDLNYQFEKGWRYLGLVPAGSVVIPEQAEALSFWALGDLKGDKLRARVKDSTGQVFQLDLAAPVPGEWTPIKIPLTQPTSGIHWGGANDGVLHKPLTWEALLVIDSTSKDNPHSGRLQVSAPFYWLTP